MDQLKEGNIDSLLAPIGWMISVAAYSGIHNKRYEQNESLILQR